jgi:acetoin utilization deacetylase AcuC-like enzyme
MTNQLMKLARGKVLLVLEGGYELNALAECGKSCVEALLGREVRFLLIFNYLIDFYLNLVTII